MWARYVSKRTIAICKQIFCVNLTFNCKLSSHKVCVVGAGPAGFYTTQRLLKGNESIHVDIIDKLPVPFGLIRFGVAPDHPEVKNVINSFTHIIKSHAHRCNFYGNIEVGKDVELDALWRFYDIIVLCYGAEIDRRLGIPGEDSKGVYSARQIVGWYNGVPDFRDLNPDLNTDQAVILGQGNVALDIARMLLMPWDDLAKTDICEHALLAIKRSGVKQVYIVGRRGPLQAAFTIKELRELTMLKSVRTSILQEDINQIDVTALPRPRKRLIELLIKMAHQPPVADASRSCHLRFLLAPKTIHSDGENGRVNGVVFTHNRLLGEASETQKAEPTNFSTTIPCGLVIRSIGYESSRVAESDILPFDEKNMVIPNYQGRVKGFRGLYCSGWVKHGPTGVLATTMADSFETAECILEDIRSGCVTASAEKVGCVISYLKTKTSLVTTDFAGWERVNNEEIRRGAMKGKPREKVITIEEMLKIAGTATPYS